MLQRILFIFKFVFNRKYRFARLNSIQNFFENDMLTTKKMQSVI